jgi:hypothetical protein
MTARGTINFPSSLTCHVSSTRRSQPPGLLSSCSRLLQICVAAANQLPEWLGRARCAPGTPRNGYDQTLRIICAELANGVKHFTLNSAIQESSRNDDSDPSAIGGPSAYRGGSLQITLDEDAARALRRSRPVISAVELAGLVLAYWKAHPMIARAERRLK